MEGGFVPFERLQVTTMTLVIKLSGNIDVNSAVYLFPVIYVPVKNGRASSKCKLPKSEIPGTIFSARRKGFARGVVRNTSNPFKNAATIDISTSRKNVSIKLSPHSVQLCGASCKMDGTEAVDQIILHLERMEGIIAKMKKLPTEAINAANWVKSASKGEKIPQVGEAETEVEEHYVKIPTCAPPETLRRDFVEVFLPLCDDFLYHRPLCAVFDHILNLEKIITDGPVRILNMGEVMVNYNYSLGFEVNRTMLNKYIDGRNGFISRYNNALASSVTIELPYPPRGDAVARRRKNKIPHHTLLVYKSGSVTQSGPGEALMRDAYYLFMETIREIRNFIEYKA